MVIGIDIIPICIYCIRMGGSESGSGHRTRIVPRYIAHRMRLQVARGSSQRKSKGTARYTTNKSQKNQPRHTFFRPPPLKKKLIFLIKLILKINIEPKTSTYLAFKIVLCRFHVVLYLFYVDDVFNYQVVVENVDFLSFFYSL